MISKTFQYFNFRSLKFNELVYPKGQKICDKLCVVLEGNIVDKKINKVEAKRYEILFEKKLSEGTEDVLKNNLVAEPDCILAEIDFDKFKETLGGDLNEAQTKSNQLASFEHVPMFRILSDDKIEFLQNNLKLEKFHNGKKIITQGEIGDKLYIIKNGRVDFLAFLIYDFIIFQRTEFKILERFRNYFRVYFFKYFRIIERYSDKIEI